MESVPVKQTSKAADRYHQPGTALNRLFSEAPYLPRCSDNKTAALVRPREYAVCHPYMQVNRPDMVSWLVFDLDHSNALIWEDQNLPVPNLVVRNRENGHSHLFYAIVPVCTSENARAKPIQYMKAVYEAMAARLDADPAYSGPVAKTPYHPWWSTWEIHGTEYELGELADHVDLVLKPRWSRGPNLNAVSHSRHCQLFESLRFYAYSIVEREREQGTYQSFIRLLEAYAHDNNNYRQLGFDVNLSTAQVKATVKSVARWTWDRYNGSSRCHRGIMNLDITLPLNERQRLSAKRTHQVRQNATASKIKTTCLSLHKQGTKLTQVAVAKATGLTRQTVANYQHVLNEISNSVRTNILPLRPEAAQVINVKYGTYQIPAVLQGSFRSSGTGEVGSLVDGIVVELESVLELEGLGKDPP